MRNVHREENLSQSSYRLKDPLKLVNQTPVARLDRWLGIIVEREGEISGHASSRPTINQCH
jgi:hypothetical protein